MDLPRTGFRTVLAVHGVVICYYLGPTRTASLTLRCALACAGYKFCETLVKSAPSGVRSNTCRSLRAPLFLCVKAALCRACDASGSCSTSFLMQSTAQGAPGHAAVPGTHTRSSAA